MERVPLLQRNSRRVMSTSGDEKEKAAEAGQLAAVHLEDGKISEVEDDTSTSTETSKSELLRKALELGPIALFYSWTAAATFVSFQPLLLEVTCKRHFQLPDDVCHILASGNNSMKQAFRTEETALQVEIANLMFWWLIITYTFPLLLVLSIGSWSDGHGRRVPLIAFLVSLVVQNAGLILCAEFPDSSLAGPWGIVIVSCLPSALVGGKPQFMMTFFSHIADTSTKQERTFLNGCAIGFLFAGIALGYNVGGLLASNVLTHTQHFGLMIVMQVAVILYACLVLKKKEKTQKLESFGQTLASFFDASLLRDAFHTIFKQRDGNLRLALGLLVLAHICSQAPWMGELSVVYIFGKYKFSWTTAEYGVFTSSRYTMGFIGNWVIGTLFSKALGVSDAWIGIFTAISGFMAYMIFVLAPTLFWMYIGALFTFGISTAQVIPRSILSKIVPTTEIGSVTAFLAVFDCLLGISAAPFYSYLYALTISVFTSAFFAVSAGLMLPPIFVYIYLLRNKPQLHE